MITCGYFIVLRVRFSGLLQGLTLFRISFSGVFSCSIMSELFFVSEVG